MKKVEACVMASTTQGASPDKRSVPERKTVSVGSMIEPATKMLTLLVVGSYALGYLIVVINENAYGFLETSLIKPRAVTAGALFILFTALPISITQGTFFGKGPDPESKLETFTRFLLSFVDYVAACCAGGLVMLFVFEDDLHGVSMTYGKTIAFMGLFVVVSLNGFLRFSAPRFYRRAPIAWIVFGVFSLCGLAFGVYSVRGFNIMRAFGWIFGLATLVNPYLSDYRRGVISSFKPTALVPLILVAVSTYSIYLFPHMKAAWGGGAAVPAVIYLSKDAPMHSGEKVKGVLIEASDTGVYVIFEGSEKAIYVPKALVTGMEFSASPKR